MFQSFEFCDFHKATYRLVVKDFAIRREHWSELECEHFAKPSTYCAIDSNLLVRPLTSEARGLKDDGRAAERCDLIHLPAVERNDISVKRFDIRAWDERLSRQDCARPTQD